MPASGGTTTSTITPAQTTLDDEHQARVRALAADFPALWSDPATPQRERKRMARLLLDDVTLLKDHQIRIHVRLRGGQTTSLTAPIPPMAWQARQTDPDTFTLLDRLLDDHTDAEVAEQLNQAGHLSGEGRPFHARIVMHLRRAHKLPSRAERLRSAGMLNLTEMAEHLDIDARTVKRWHAAGLLRGHKANDKNERLYEPPPPATPASLNTWVAGSQTES